MTRALISVSDKTGIIEFAQELHKLDIEIISTGGTKKTLDAAGIPTKSVEDITDFPEMLDGRVKTLHPKIHGGLLGLRDAGKHEQEMEAHGIEPIDFVVVNLYPFKETISNQAVTFEDAIENIDIGGPSMLRSAAKNHQSVTVVTDPEDYSTVIQELKNEGSTTLDTRMHLAAKVFRKTAGYDALIADYLSNFDDSDVLNDSLTLTYDLKQELRYGENNHQKATFYQEALPKTFSVASEKQLHGKEMSYNNIKDADSALKIVAEFDQPAAVAVKHTNPCGVAVGEDILQAFERCYQSDSLSIFGGIVALNRPVTADLAEVLSGIFLEIILAPQFDDEALAILTKKKNVRLYEIDFTDSKDAGEKEVVSVMGGLLVQDRDDLDEDPSDWEVMTDKAPSQQELEAMEFAWKVVKHVKSNAIVVTNHHQTLGIGAGQMNRVGAAEIALKQMEESSLDKSTMVLASDAFLPMDDTVQLTADYGVSAIVQTGGSVRDKDSIELANKLDMTMVKTSIRHFKH